MSASNSTDVAGWALAVGLAVVVAGAAWFSLASFAAPLHLHPRLASSERLIGKAEAQLQRGSSDSAFPLGSVCRQSAALATPALQARLQSAASSVGLTLSSLSVTPSTSGEALNEIDLRFEAIGRYDAVLGMLSLLQRGQPLIFADTADLVSLGSGVDFKFAGKIFCSAHA